MPSSRASSVLNLMLPILFMAFSSSVEQLNGEQWTPNQESVVGLQLRRTEGQVVVSSIQRQLAADTAGVVLGDSVIAINDNVVSSLSIEKVGNLMTGVTPGTPVKLTLRRNNEVIQRTIVTDRADTKLSRIILDRIKSSAVIQAEMQQAGTTRAFQELEESLVLEVRGEPNTNQGLRHLNDRLAELHVSHLCAVPWPIVQLAFERQALRGPGIRVQRILHEGSIKYFVSEISASSQAKTVVRIGDEVVHVNGVIVEDADELVGMGKTYILLAERPLNLTLRRRANENPFDVILEATCVEHPQTRTKESIRVWEFASIQIGSIRIVDFLSHDV